MRAWVRAEGAAARRDWAPSVSAQRRMLLRLRIRSRWPRRGVTAGGLGICRGFEPGRGKTNFPPESETGRKGGRYRACLAFRGEPCLLPGPDAVLLGDGDEQYGIR